MSFKASRIKQEERKLHRFLFRLAGKIWRRSSSTNLKNSGAVPMPPHHRRHRQSTHHSCQTRGNDRRGESHQRKKEIRLRERDTRASVFSGEFQLRTIPSWPGLTILKNKLSVCVFSVLFWYKSIICGMIREFLSFWFSSHFFNKTQFETFFYLLSNFVSLLCLNECDFGNLV